jgi:hypothetical protein
VIPVQRKAEGNQTRHARDETLPVEPSLTSDADQDHPATVRPEEAALLRAMLKIHPTRITAVQLGQRVRLEEKCIGRHLKALTGRGLVDEKTGKGGRGLTAVGLEMARTLSEDAGQHLMRPLTNCPPTVR